MEVLPFCIGLITVVIIVGIIFIVGSIVGYYRYKEEHLLFCSRIDEDFKRNINERVTELENMVFSSEDKGVN